MEARCSCGCGVATLVTWFGHANANPECASRRTFNTFSKNICANNRSVFTQWFRTTRFSSIGWWSAWTHLHTLRRLRQLRSPRIAPTDRVRHCWSFWWVIRSLTLNQTERKKHVLVPDVRSFACVCVRACVVVKLIDSSGFEAGYANVPSRRFIVGRWVALVTRPKGTRPRFVYENLHVLGFF